MQSISKFGLVGGDRSIFVTTSTSISRGSRSSSDSRLAKDRHSGGFRTGHGTDHDRNRTESIFTKSSDLGRATQELRTIQDWIVKLQLRTVPGVADVLSFGGDVKQYHVIVDQQALVNYNIPLKSLFEAIQHNNQNTGANFIEHGDEQYVVRGLGLVKDVEDIKNIVLDSRGGTPIRVSDVAQVRNRERIRQGAVTKDGQGEVVTGIVLKRINENTKQVIERVKEKVVEINKSLPEGVSIVDYYDQSELVDNSIHTVVKSLIEGEVLVLIILLLLLGDFRGLAHHRRCDSVLHARGFHPHVVFRAFGQSHFAWRAGDKHRHDGRCDRRDGRKHLSPS